MSHINLIHLLNPQHFPIFTIMLYFLGAFLIVLFGKKRFLRNCIAFIATGLSLTLLILLIKPILIDGGIIA